MLYAIPDSFLPVVRGVLSGRVMNPPTFFDCRRTCLKQGHDLRP